MNRCTIGAIAPAVAVGAADACISDDRLKVGTIASNAMQPLKSPWIAEFIILWMNSRELSVRCLD
jgi:hypothetical protein